MTTISLAKNMKALLRGAKTVMVVAPARTLTKRRLPKLLGKRNDDLLIELARDAPAGDMGASNSSLTGRDPRVLAVGVLPDSVSRHNAPSRAESIRRVVASVGAGKGKTSIILVLDDAAHATAAVNAVGRAFPLFSEKSSGGPGGRVQLLAVGTDGKQLEIPERAMTVMNCTRDSAALVDTPPTELNPVEYAARIKAMLKGVANVKVKEIAGEKLVTEGLMGIHSVGRAAVKAPRMVVATYTPAEPSGRHIALVGKGVTYDTGGLNIKVGGNMPGMKCDMGGSAATLGAFRVLAASGCPHTVSLLMCLAENAVGPDSYKPDDIIKMHSGKAVEINNTDAEGRLLLADGVSYAARVLEVDTVINAATLTGAQLISTGVLHAAVVSNDEDLERRMLEAGRSTGDLCHPLPFAPEFFKHEFASTVADFRNSVASRMNAQSSCAAQFVYWHIEDQRVKWAHIDLAGPAFPKDRGTGFGVALIADVVAGL